MALKETLAGIALAKVLINAWDRHKQRKHEKWKLRLQRELENLTYERNAITGEIICKGHGRPYPASPIYSLDPG